jgi:hypothetical protein
VKRAKKTIKRIEAENTGKTPFQLANKNIKKQRFYKTNRSCLALPFPLPFIFPPVFV